MAQESADVLGPWPYRVSEAIVPPSMAWELDVKPARSSMDSLSLEELFDCGRYGRSAVAENEHGELVSIYDVPRGLACNCVCPSCRRQMVARTKDDIRVAHFAHYGTGTETCTTAGETALHMFAKKLANERLEIFIPELVEEVDFERETVVSARRLRFDEAVLEQRTGRIVPDVILTAQGRRLIVEFRVTHECGPEKIARIRELDIGAIEIDLSDYRGAKLRKLADAILFSAPRKWLHNPNSKAARARAGARAHLRRSAVANEVAALSELYRHPSLSSECGNGAYETVARRDGLGNLINIDINGAGCFVVSSAEWQAATLLLVLKDKVGIQPSEIFDRLKKLEWVATWATNISDEVESGLRGSVPNYLPPEEAIATYLDEMEVQGFVVKRWDGSLQPSRDLADLVQAAQNRRDRPIKRFEEARKVVDGLLKPLPEEETSGFDFDKWADAPVGPEGISLIDAVKSEEQDWRPFMARLRTLWSDIRHRPETTSDLMGLPLEAELGRSRERKIQQQVSRDEEQRKANALKAEARIRDLQSAAWHSLGEKADAWLMTSLPELGDRTPSQAVEHDEALLQQAIRLLERRVEVEREKRLQEQERESALYEVSRFAREKLGDLQAGYWLKGFHPKLGARPTDYVVDEATRNACLRLIDPKVNIEKLWRGQATR